MQNIDAITAQLDSIATKLDLLYASSPDYSRPLANDFGWIAVVTLFATLVGLAPSIYGALSQRATQKNTDNLTSEAIDAHLKDLIRHFYRNLVVVCAMELKLTKNYRDQKGHFLGYPSEEHFLKLAAPYDWMTRVNHRDLSKVLNEGGKKTVSLSALQTLYRNFDIEIQVACEHFKDKSLATVVKLRDLSTLKFKQKFLAEETYKVLMNYRRVLDIMAPEETTMDIQEYVKKHSNYESTQSKTPAKSVAHYKAEDLGFFAENLFPNDKEFIAAFNRDVNAECGQNKDGYDKIFIIRY